VQPRCRRIVAVDDEASFPTPLDDKQIERLFKEFDTSGDGFIDLGELKVALSRAGEAVTKDAAEDILKRVDANKDGQISLEEFKAVFQLAPDAVPEGLKPLTGVAGFFLDSLGRVGDALGIEVPGQWRTTAYGSRYVDDVVGYGNLIRPGDVARIHYTVTLLSTDQIVETSRGGPPPGFQVDEPAGDVQNWSDAVAGMRIGGQRRVYAKPSSGDGPTARYDIEIVSVESDAGERSALDEVITSLGGRRAAFRLLFAASFIPYFLPEAYQPAFFRDDPPTLLAAQETEATDKVDPVDAYTAKALDSLFANELPKRQ